MHYLENPLYSLEFVFLLVSFSDLFRIKSNRRNCTPKQQQWVANFSVTTNILPYLTVQIENIFCCCCLCISSSINLKEGQKWSACWFLDTPPPPQIAFCFSPDLLHDPWNHTMPKAVLVHGDDCGPTLQAKGQICKHCWLPCVGFLQNSGFQSKHGFLTWWTCLEQVKHKVTAFFKTSHSWLKTSQPGRCLYRRRRIHIPPKPVFVPSVMHSLVDLVRKYISAAGVLRHKLWQGRLLPDIRTIRSMIESWFVLGFLWCIKPPPFPKWHRPGWRPVGSGVNPQHLIFTTRLPCNRKHHPLPFTDVLLHNVKAHPWKSCCCRIIKPLKAKVYDMSRNPALLPCPVVCNSSAI